MPPHAQVEVYFFGVLAGGVIVSCAIYCNRNRFSFNASHPAQRDAILSMGI